MSVEISKNPVGSTSFDAVESQRNEGARKGIRDATITVMTFKVTREIM